MRRLVSSARKAREDEVQEAKGQRRPTHRQTRQLSGRMTISRIGGRTTKQRRRSTRGSSMGLITSAQTSALCYPMDDPPLTHETTADLWIMTAGTASAETDGELIDGNGPK